MGVSTPSYFLRYFRFSCKYANVIRLDVHEILNVLTKLGYRVSERIPPRMFKASVVVSGIIAQKPRVLVDMNTDARIIGVISLEPALAMNEFNEIEENELNNTVEVCLIQTSVSLKCTLRMAIG